MWKKWKWLAAIALFTVACGASQSNRSEAAFRCSLAQFNGDPGAAKLCQDDCAAGEAEACTSLGSMYSRGHLVPQSHSDALRYVDRGCDLGDATGCYYAGRLRTESDDKLVRVSSLERACLDAELTYKDDKRFACYESATAYLNGFGVPVDRKRGVQLASEACKAGSFDACDGNFSRAPVYFDGGNQQASKPAPADDPPRSPGMTLNIGEMKADGLMLRDLSCKGVQGGLGAGLMIVGSLSKQKSALDACKATKDVSLAWTVNSSTMSNAEATSEEAEAAACVQNILAATPMPEGDCTATYPPQ